MIRGASSVGSSRRHSGADICSLHPTYSRANGRNASAGGAVASSQRPSAEVCRVTLARGRTVCELHRCVMAWAGRSSLGYIGLYLLPIPAIDTGAPTSAREPGTPFAACRTGVNNATRMHSTDASERKPGAEHHLPQIPAGRVQDELDVVQHRNTPFADVGVPVTARTGSPGIDRLISQDAVAGGSVTIG